MNALHALGAERGAELKRIAENTILDAVVKEIETTRRFDSYRLDRMLSSLKQEHPDMRDVLNVHITLTDTRIRSSLLTGADAVEINLEAADIEQIEQGGSTIHTVEGQNATAIVIKYRVMLTPPGPVERQMRAPTDPSGLTGISPHRDVGWRVEGYIQVLFDVPYIGRSIRNSLLRHAMLIVIAGALLVILIDLTTNHLIMKPLEGMTGIIQGAASGSISPEQTYSSDEIGRATQNLVRMLWQLRDSHSKRMNALGQLAAGVAHEIRNPLNSIGMTAQHLTSVFSQEKVNAADIEEAKELLEIVDNKIVELKQISEQFLTLNRPRQLNLRSTDLNALVDQVLAEFGLIAEEANVQIIKNYDQTVGAVQLDAGLMRQTVFNLVQNSIQAMPKGGSIYITTFSEEEVSAVREAVLEIRDTGIGIPEEIHEQIYDAYFTTKDAIGGMGLGLAVSHQIITAHQGRIEVRSKLGMGTAFKINLPLNRK